jgi:hypothetical protein
MALVQQIPPYTQFLNPVRRFSAVFNATTPNKYDFGIPANTDQPFLPVRKELLYLFDKQSFSASMNEGVFLKAVDSNAGIPSTLLSIRVPSQNNKLIYRGKIPLINYIDNSDILFFAYAEQDDTLTITFEGVLSQPIELLGELTIFTQLTFNVYEIRNKEWINNFLRRTNKGLGRNLLDV